MPRGRPNRPFQDNYRKDSKTQNIFRKRKDMILGKDISKHRKQQIIIWSTFWRRNIHRFILDVMGVKLYPFQILWVWMLNEFPFFVGVCSRTASKSFVIACFSVARSILYPGLQTLISATTLRQAGQIVSSKIKYLQDNSPVCQAEIKTLTSNNNLYQCEFHNGSRIIVVAANEGSRGWRSNDLIIDEYAIADKQVVDEVLKPTLFPRQVPYLQQEEYSNLIEPVRSYYISTCRYAHEWWYKTALLAIKGMIEENGSGFFATDYLTSIRHNLKTREQIDEEKRTNSAFGLEYENIPGKSNINSFYHIDMFKRTIHKAFYPMRKQDYILKKNPFAIPKVIGELRVMGVDLAIRKARANDNSVTSCVRLIPSKRGYERQLVYMESSHGTNGIVQAERIKNIWYDFGADYIAMDVAGPGMGVFDSLSTNYYNEERGVQMPAFSVMNTSEIDQKIIDELRERTLGTNPLAIIFPISATAGLNTEIHAAFRSSLQKKLWRFLVSEVEGEDFLIKNVKGLYNHEDETLRNFMLHPYLQTEFFISEALNLELKIVNSNIKLTEGTGLKDRYSSVAYANLLCSIFDKELLRESDGGDEWAIWQSMTFISSGG